MGARSRPPPLHPGEPTTHSQRDPSPQSNTSVQRRTLSRTPTPAPPGAHAVQPLLALQTISPGGQDDARTVVGDTGSGRGSGTGVADPLWGDGPGHTGQGRRGGPVARRAASGVGHAPQLPPP